MSRRILLWFAPLLASSAQMPKGAGGACVGDDGYGKPCAGDRDRLRTLVYEAALLSMKTDWPAARFLLVALLGAMRSEDHRIIDRMASAIDPKWHTR